ncbi:MAG: hypothetical protein AAF939_03355 [Planctomycetota bacterium]
MIVIPVDPLNPGHVFAAVGLTELAYRITGNALGSFDNSSNYCLEIENPMTIAKLIKRIQAMEIIADVPTDNMTSLRIGGLRLNWWTTAKVKDREAGNLKVWAPKQSTFKMAASAKAYLCCEREILFDRREVFESGTRKPIALPSLDAQRAPTTVDTGYSPNELGHKIIPAPSVEFFAMVGLQRAFPAKNKGRFAYSTWTKRLPPSLLPAAIAGYISPQNEYVFGIAKDGKNSRVSAAQQI